MSSPRYATLYSRASPESVPLVPNDPSSRYKTRQLQVLYVGRSRLQFPNIADVIHDMKLPDPLFLLQFLAYELNVRAQFQPKKAPKEQAALFGHVTLAQLDSALRGFILEFLLCQTCQLPELLLFAPSTCSTKTNTTFDKMVFARCGACGAKNTISQHNLNAKFARFVGKSLSRVQVSGFEGPRLSSHTFNALLAYQEQEHHNAKLQTLPQQEYQQQLSFLEDETVEQADEEEEQQSSEEDEPTLVDYLVGNSSALPSMPISPRECLAVLQQSAPQLRTSLSKNILRQSRFLAKLGEFAVRSESILRSLSVILQNLYSLEVIEEDAIRTWFAECCDPRQRSASQTMLDWLSD